MDAVFKSFTDIIKSFTKLFKNRKDAKLKSPDIHVAAKNALEFDMSVVEYYFYKTSLRVQ